MGPVNAGANVNVRFNGTLRKGVAEHVVGVAECLLEFGADPLIEGALARVLKYVALDSQNLL